MSNYRLQQK
uniref:Uncharacterized protein n=1 Tax=Anguilla anguilla TaxID=7936 RepID=A0A0E9TMW0_ANGAN